MRVWRGRSRGVLLTALLVLGVWLTSMVTINLTPVTKNYERSLFDGIRLRHEDASLDFGDFTGEQRTPRRELGAQLAEVARSLHRAMMHVRGTKTSDELRHSSKIIDDVLRSLGINKDKLLRRNVMQPKNVCPEKYMGSTFGYPFFYKGFEIEECRYAKPIAELVTVIHYIKSSDAEGTKRRKDKFISSLKNIPNLTAVIALHQDLEQKVNFPENIKLVYLNERKSEGYVWNRLVAEVNTPYVLVARDVEFLTEDVRLERLVRELEMLQVPVVAGALRYPDGRWKKGCYQSVHRNYTLRYVEGYDESLHECIFCDFSLGPFITHIETLKSVPFVEIDMENGVFEDWFLRLNQIGKETIVCPDSMFHVRSTKDISWSTFMNHLGLYKMISPTGHTEVSDCSTMGKTLDSRALSPCKLEANADAVNGIMKACEQSGIICELQEGTALGAVKFEKVLPWERDADLAFLSGNYSAFQKLKDHFQKRGYTFVDLKSLWCCADNRTAGGKFALGYRSWTIEMYGQHLMDSETLLAQGMQPTRVLLDGNWVMVPRNPGLFVRNRYGHEVYQHAVHWMTSKRKSGWDPYKTNVFPTCDVPGQHNCLDRCNADGDLPFADPLP